MVVSHGPSGIPYLEVGSRLDAFSAYPVAGWLPSAALGEQLVHQRSVRPGPLVLGTAPLRPPAPTADRDRTVSRRSEPSSRAALMGEQPNPGTYFSPRMRRADIEVPNLAVAVSAWARSACYPRGSFYPVNPGASTRHQRVIRPGFRPCSTSRSHSQPPLCPYTRRVISDHAEGSFGRLRYLLGNSVRPAFGSL